MGTPPCQLPFTDPGAYEADRLSAFYDALHRSGRSAFYDRATGLEVVWRHDDVAGILLGKYAGVTNSNSLDPLTPMGGFIANPATWRPLAYLLRWVRPATANASGQDHDMVRRVVVSRHDRRSINPSLTRQHYENVVQRRVAAVINALGEQASAGMVDFGEVVAGPLAATVIGDILGFPQTAARSIQDWAHGQASLLGREMHGRMAVAIGALAELARACAACAGRAIPLMTWPRCWARHMTARSCLRSWLPRRR